MLETSRLFTNDVLDIETISNYYLFKVLKKSKSIDVEKKLIQIFAHITKHNHIAC